MARPQQLVLIALLAASGIAGCAGAPPEPGPEPVDAAAPAPRTAPAEATTSEVSQARVVPNARAFEETFPVEVTEIDTSGVVPVAWGAGRNCIMLAAGPLMSNVTGTVSAAWAASSPLSEELELRLSTDDAAVGEAVVGRSPLALTIDVEAVERLRVYLGAPPALSGVIQQSAELSLTIEYAAAQEARASGATCVSAG